MAEKKEKNNNGILSIFTKEYKYEGIILLALSLIALVLGTMVLIGETSQGASGLVINKDIFLIGDYPKAFAWILIILGAVSLVLAAWPFYKPSISEIKRVSWPNRGTLLKNTATVFAFILVLSIFFIFSDWIFGYVVELFGWLSNKL
ncbi:MAG TPA: preprotein translocase subunit SecE [Bacilli bacterium]|jgi:preprotein translocase SecE subunit|nr:preprotein translocase subunit SecE [Acholeplasmataceae bacterium]HNZ77204.1 preprotein translocase subunit SecE [Bacilli bacterium]HOD61237.1 preprotein translocase subunit SecE [Bacilli bacterium]HOH61509.1 preprotein translocase subunit SecE [Bacilli bacterium]HPB49424.1 preprotein translocase subunit SecE [Bacilli bacterium]